MQSINADISKLKTIANYAAAQGVTTSYIYKLVKEQKIVTVEIDGVKFINVAQYPTIRHTK
jgi:hypothetical protein